MSKEPKPDFDEEFGSAIKAWRSKHKLKEDDAVFLLVELFRIHQKHWDEVRHREMPSFEQFRGDLIKLTEAARRFQQEAGALVAVLHNHPPAINVPRITRTAAFFAALASLLAGYIIGRVW
jgi:hypothetical protein